MISVSEVEVHFSIACSSEDKEFLSKKIYDTLEIFWKKRFETDYRSVIDDLSVEVRFDGIKEAEEYFKKETRNDC